MKINRPNFFLILFLCGLVVVEILFLRPTNIETNEEEPQTMFSSIGTLVQAQKTNEDVGYTIDGFHYTAVEGEVKHWELIAKEAILYEQSRVMHAQEAKIKMFDVTEKITYIEGDHAFYKMGNKDLDLEGNVKVTFPDGLWIKTTKAHYDSGNEEVSTAEPFYGETTPEDGEMMHMWGKGFRARKTGPIVYILDQAHVLLRRSNSEEITDVRSNKAQIDRDKKIANFYMDDARAFVESMQGTLHVRSRLQTATYDPSHKDLKYMTADDDVLIREMDEKKSQTGLKYATCQKAEFFTQENKVFLSGFPAAYQQGDTVTGDFITLYRDKNIIEVTQANAFHEAQLAPKKTEEKE